MRPHPKIARRSFLQSTALGAAAGWLWPAAIRAEERRRRQPFLTRGVVLIPDDFTWKEWPGRVAKAGLNTIALHHGRSVYEVVKFVQSKAGEEFLDRTRKLGLQVEYELHAMNDLLPRRLFEEDKSMFRMSDKGERVADANLCVHSEKALETVAKNALVVGQLLRPTSGRYFYWGDDGQPWCRCPKCREFSDSEQALILENSLIKTLRAADPKAQLAHLAYANSIAAPVKVRPEPGVFLEYAPIRRRYDAPYATQPGGADALSNLDKNLQVFSAETAQVLEYWLDVSRFSGWKRPAKKLPWNRELFLADVEAYAARGIRHVTSFACYIDAEYIKLYGEPAALEDYGKGLAAGVQRK